MKFQKQGSGYDLKKFFVINPGLSRFICSFSLYANDGRIDDYTYCNQVERGQFRLNQKVGLGIRKGCITVEHRAHFNQIRSILTSVKLTKVPGSDNLMYGNVIIR